MNTHPRIQRMAGRIMALMGNYTPRVGPLRDWTRARTRPRFARRTLHAQMRRKGAEHD